MSSGLARLALEEACKQRGGVRNPAAHTSEQVASDVARSTPRAHRQKSKVRALKTHLTKKHDRFLNSDDTLMPRLGAVYTDGFRQRACCESVPGREVRVVDEPPEVPKWMRCQSAPRPQKPRLEQFLFGLGFAAVELLVWDCWLRRGQASAGACLERSVSESAKDAHRRSRARASEVRLARRVVAGDAMCIRGVGWRGAVLYICFCGRRDLGLRAVLGMCRPCTSRRRSASCWSRSVRTSKPSWPPSPPRQRRFASWRCCSDGFVLTVGFTRVCMGLDFARPYIPKPMMFLLSVPIA